MLGPVEVWAGERRIDVGFRRQRLVLAVLVAEAQRPVPVDTLIDRVWGQAAPVGARQSMHAHVSRVRQVLRLADEPGVPPAEVVFASGCYRLDVDESRVDVHRFRRLIAQARDVDCAAEQRVVLLREALGLWRAEPLAGLDGPWVDQTRQAWRLQYLDALVWWARAELQAANPSVVISMLTTVANEHPLAEPVAAALMHALVAAGRPAEALARYETTRRYLVEELGTDPSGELQAAHRAILRGENPAGPPPAGVERSGPPAVPAQLPRDVTGFTGRAEYLSELDDWLAGSRPDGDLLEPRAPGDRATATPTAAIAVVSGTAGVGKTALVVRWAHAVASRFPDGQLYVDLRGFGPGDPLDPYRAARRFLEALQVPAGRIPADPEAQQDLYRTVLAGRRILIVLDNARDAGQVRPLLPGGQHCVVVVTSRNRLSGLVAVEGAHSVTVDVLSLSEARGLLTRRIGSRRVDNEPGPTREIIEYSAGLPLALNIAAARATTHPTFALADIARELRDVAGRLDAFVAEETTADVRAVLSWSYRTLSPAGARMFRLLSLSGGPDIAMVAAAALAGLPPAAARPLLVELSRAHLITERAPGRFGFHDLLRAYATELNVQHETADENSAARRRLLDHYLSTAHTAALLVAPRRTPLDIAATVGDSAPEKLSDHVAANAWFTDTSPSLLSTVDLAAAHRFDTHAWQLAWCLSNFLEWRGHWPEWCQIQETAVRAAERANDPRGMSHSHHQLGRAYTKVGRFEAAQEHYERSLAMDDGVSRIDLHRDLAWMWDLRERPDLALRHARTSLELSDGADDDAGRARALNAIGWYLVQEGDFAAAVAHCEQALVLHGRLGNRPGEAATWDSLGYARHHLGDHRTAIDCYRKALEITREINDRTNAAMILDHLGDAYRADGDLPAASNAWRQALLILTEMRDETSAGAQISAKLAEIGA